MILTFYKTYCDDSFKIIPTTTNDKCPLVTIKRRNEDEMDVAAHVISNVIYEALDKFFKDHTRIKKYENAEQVE